MTFKLGRRPLIAPKMCMKFSGYQLKSFPTPPASWDYTPAAMGALSEMYLNDQLGCCVISWMAHAIGVFIANAVPNGTPDLFSDQQIISMYGAIGGYNPADPSTDQGCDENTAINFWMNPGFLGHKIQGVISVDPTDQQQVQDCGWLFENLMFGVGLPQAWIDPMPSASGFHWSIAGDSIPENGHCFGSAKGGANGLGVSSWGMEGTIDYPAVAKYAANSAGGQLFSVITQEILNNATQRAPNGFDWQALCADCTGLGGTLKL
jgi:hypothetical protein